MKKLIALLAVIVTGPAWANTYSTTPGYISNFYALSSGGVTFDFSTTPGGSVSCSPTPTAGRYAIDGSTAAGQTQLSLLLTAYSQHKRINLVASGTCTVVTGAETISFFNVVD